MATFFSDDSELEIPVSEEEIESVVDAVLSAEGVERECEVSVSIVDSEEMAALNAKWRGIDAPTDVLSFECDSPFDESIPREIPIELGDIVLAPEVIAAQAPEFGNTPAEEFRLLLVHGMLHLLGYDHVDEEGAKLMEARELAILQNLARTRGEDPAVVRIGPTTRHALDEGAA